MTEPTDPSADIGFLELKVQQDARKDVVLRYTLASLPLREECVAPNCQGGGLNLHATARVLRAGIQHFYCQGYTNGLRGHATAQPCSNCFTVEARTAPNQEHDA